MCVCVFIPADPDLSVVESNTCLVVGVVRQTATLVANGDPAITNKDRKI